MIATGTHGAPGAPGAAGAGGPVQPGAAARVPTVWQKKVLWAAVTALSVVVIAAVAVLLVMVIGRVARFLQPILIPFAMAGVMAYLIDPAVTWIARHGVPRARAVQLVFLAVTVLLFGLVVWVGPALTKQSIDFARRIPVYSGRTATRVLGVIEHVRQEYGIKILPELVRRPPGDRADAAGGGGEAVAGGAVVPDPLGTGTGGTLAAAAAANVPPTAAAAGTAATEGRVGEKPEVGVPGMPDGQGAAGVDGLAIPAVIGPLPPPSTHDEISLEGFLSGTWLQDVLPTLLTKTWEFIRTSVGGFLGVFGFLLNLIIVPLYLYYFLANSTEIAASWHQYLPLRASAFKDEVVGALTEINGYLIAFFRGQLVVAMINGLVTGTGLMLMGLNFALLIGLLIAVLNLIPYVGIVLCWLPAVVIAAVQYGDWMHPLGVTLIFIGAQQLDGWFITPRIVGSSVGLHPLTIIVSVFGWSLLLGGLLGAILAVPLTATLKVLLKRYVWAKRDGLGAAIAMAGAPGAAGEAAAAPPDRPGP